MNRPKFLAVVLVVFPALVAPLHGPWGLREAAAQDIPSPYRYIETTHEAGALFGIMSPGTGRFDLGPDQGTVLGARYAIELSGPFSLEGVIRSLSSTRQVRDPLRPEAEQNRGEAEVLLTSVDARIKFSLNGRRTWNGIGPYVLLGGGLGTDLAANPPEDEELLPEDRFDFGTSFLGILGLGARWFPREDVVVRLDGEMDLWQLDTPEGYLDLDRNLFENPPPESEWVSALGLTLGVAYRW